MINKNLHLLLTILIVIIPTIPLTAGEIQFGHGIYSGKLKKGQPAGKGDLIIKANSSSYGYNHINTYTISGDFQAIGEGKTLVIGSLLCNNNPLIANAEFILDVNNPDSICIKNGYEFIIDQVELLDLTQSSPKILSNIKGKTTENEYLIFKLKDGFINIVYPTNYTSFTLDKVEDGIGYSGYGLLGKPVYIQLEIDETHYKRYKNTHKHFFVLESYSEGNDWAYFNTDFESHSPFLITKFYKERDQNSLSGELVGFIQDKNSNVTGTKFNGKYKQGDIVYVGEFVLDEFPIFNEINTDKLPHFLKVKKQAPENKKNHKRLILHKGGTILSHITLEEVNDIDSLTITGIMYRSDCNILEEMRNLEYLDLSNAFITYSPQEKEEQRAEREFQEAFLQMMSHANESKRKDKDIDTIQYEQNKLFLEILNSTKDIEPKSDPCFVPKIKNLPALKTLLLPNLAQWITDDAFMNCPNLENVVLPKYLKSIHKKCFSNCQNLKEIKFPKTLESLYTDFENCKSIETIDLGGCRFKNTHSIFCFKGCASLTKFVFPSNAEKAQFIIANDQKINIYIPKSAEIITVQRTTGEGTAIVHFHSQTPPRSEGLYYSPVLYIPKGSLTEYYSEYGKEHEYIEE